MKAYVVDTSALVRLYVPDGPIPDALEPAVLAASRAEALLLAPELLWAETWQVLLKKERSGLLSRDDVGAIIGAIGVLPLEPVSHRGLLSGAIERARRFGLTVYDAVFLELAFARSAELITADDELAKAWRSSAMKTQIR